MPRHFLDKKLQEYFGFEKLYIKQKEITFDLLNKHNVMVVLATGFGKSLCFQLSGLLKPGMVIVVSPLISLINDQVNTLNSLTSKNKKQKLKLAYAYHSLINPKDKKELFWKIENFDRSYPKVKFVYLSPESLEGFLRRIGEAKNKISMVIVDEAHCILHWGKSFRKAYLSLPSLINKELPDTTKALFTASLSQKDKKEIEELFFKGQNFKFHANSIYRKNLNIKIQRHIFKFTKFFELKKILKKQRPSLVYCSTIKELEGLYGALSPEFKDLRIYHGKLPRDKRLAAEKFFIRDKCPQLLVTNAFGMGIDKKDVREVVHWQPSANLLDYYQEIGRAGRDRKPANCTLLYSRGDFKALEYFQRKEESPKKLLAFKKFLENKRECRWQQIMNHFDEHNQENFLCFHCDNCHQGS